MFSRVGASVPGLNNNIHLTTQPSSRFKQIKSFYSSLPSMMTIVKVIGLALLFLPNIAAQVSPNCPSLTDVPMGCSLNTSEALYARSVTNPSVEIQDPRFLVCRYSILCDEDGKNVMYGHSEKISGRDSIKWACGNVEVLGVKDDIEWRFCKSGGTLLGSKRMDEIDDDSHSEMDRIDDDSHSDQISPSTCPDLTDLPTECTSTSELIHSRKYDPNNPAVPIPDSSSCMYDISCDENGKRVKYIHFEKASGRDTIKWECEKFEVLGIEDGTEYRSCQEAGSGGTRMDRIHDDSPHSEL